ncbi:MAG: hypothetical protein QXX68_01430 [Candidatus Pacearchaeota archaeon]
MKTKKAAMELSIGTIVIVVIAMVMLVLGIMLVRNIFFGSQRAVSGLNDQVSNEINKLFGEDKKIVIYPSTKQIEVRQGKQEGFAIGIKNKLSGSQAKNALFSYEITPVSNVENDCGVSKEDILNLFVAESYRGEDIPIPTGENEPIVILFETGEGDPLCTVRFRIDVKANENNYATTQVYVKFRD